MKQYGKEVFWAQNTLAESTMEGRKGSTTWQKA
jgi:hypothetical protein